MSTSFANWGEQAHLRGKIQSLSLHPVEPYHLSVHLWLHLNAHSFRLARHRNPKLGSHNFSIASIELIANLHRREPKLTIDVLHFKLHCNLHVVAICQ